MAKNMVSCNLRSHLKSILSFFGSLWKEQLEVDHVLGLQGASRPTTLIDIAMEKFGKEYHNFDDLSSCSSMLSSLL